MAVVDTGAGITVFKRKRMELSVARLRMKNATAHSATLYGPVKTEIDIQGNTYTFPVYEANIAENLIKYDFLEKFNAKLQVREGWMMLGKHKVPFKKSIPINKGDFEGSKLYYTVRTSHRVLLRPYVERQLQTELETDRTTDELGPPDALLARVACQESMEQSSTLSRLTTASDASVCIEKQRSCIVPRHKVALQFKSGHELVPKILSCHRLAQERQKVMVNDSHKESQSVI